MQRQMTAEVDQVVACVGRQGGCLAEFCVAPAAKPFLSRDALVVVGNVQRVPMQTNVRRVLVATPSAVRDVAAIAKRITRPFLGGLHPVA